MEKRLKGSNSTRLKEKCMNNLLSQITLLNDKTIESCIFYIREQQVMLDSDVAFFFGVTVSSLNRQMRRNVDRFPSDFCFQLSDKETNDLRCQKGTTKAEFGNKLGLSKQDSIKYVLKMAEGTIALDLISYKAPLELGKEVCSPRGSTIEGVNTLLDNGIYHLIESAGMASYKKNKKYENQLRNISSNY